MKIRRKVFTIILFLLIISIIGIYIMAQVEISRNIKLQEKDVMINNINQTKYLIDNGLEELNTITC